MVGLYGSPDEVFDRKFEMSLIASILFTVFSTSVPLAPFERKIKEYLKGDFGYYLATGLWTFAMLFIAFAWWLGSRSEGFEFGLRTAYFGTLVGAIVFNVCWATTYFVDSGAPPRYWLSLLYMFVGWLSTIAALAILITNMVRNWAVITAIASAIVAAIFLFINIVVMIGAFVYFYTMQTPLSKLTEPIRRLVRGRGRHQD